MMSHRVTANSEVLGTSETADAMPVGHLVGYEAMYQEVELVTPEIVAHEKVRIEAMDACQQATEESPLVGLHVDTVGYIVVTTTPTARR